MGLFDSIFGGGQSKGQRKALITEAFAYGEDTYSYLGKGRERAEEKYESGFATGQARLAASGATLEGSTWENLQGELLRERTESLSTLDREQEEFRGSESYKVILKEYETISRSGSATGITGESIFTEDQQKLIAPDTRKYAREREHRGEVLGDHTDYNTYNKMIMPSIEEWELGRFGSEEQKAGYQSMLDTRISEANEWYDTKKAQDLTDRLLNKRFYKEER